MIWGRVWSRPDYTIGTGYTLACHSGSASVMKPVHHFRCCRYLLCSILVRCRCCDVPTWTVQLSWLYPVYQWALAVWRRQWLWWHEWWESRSLSRQP